MSERVKILATKDQLLSVGIDEDLTNQVLPVIDKFPDGWIQVKANHKVAHLTFSYGYDLPGRWTEKITEN